MSEDLLKIINHYGVMPQLKYFQSEVFELNEAIINGEFLPFKTKQEIEHIAEEIADCYVMLEQFRQYYGISNVKLRNFMEFKIARQLERINEKDGKK